MSGTITQYGRCALCAVPTMLVLATQAQGTELPVPSQYANIQAAIDAAEDGDVVIVADLGFPGYSGVGFRNIDFLGKAIEVRSQGGVPGDCWINCASSGRAFHFHSGESFDSVVRGFTITGAYAQGGAILCENSGPTIVRCVITQNTATTGGYEGGGGLCLVDSSPTISNCDISSNLAREGFGVPGGHGGGVYCVGLSSPVLVNCTIAGNTAEHQGGAVYAYNGARPVLLHCTVRANKAEDYIGQIYCVSAHPAIINCQIHDNSDAGGDFGGAILCRQGSVATVTNCTIADNNVNVAWPGGGLFCEGTGQAVVTNSIFWGNSGQQIVYEPPAEPPTVEYCTVQGGWPGATNISDDPLFVVLGQPGDWFYGKYYLSQTATGDPNQTQDSPCLNAGNDTAENLGLWGYTTRTDFVGDDYDSMVDMGYHYSRDCDSNSVPDPIDLADNTYADCNYNGVPDECDILIADGGTCDPALSICSSDVYPAGGDGVPDECEGEPTSGVFTVNADFDLGTLINVHHDDPTEDQLQRYEYSRPLPYLWVAASGLNRGSVLRIYTGDDPSIGQLGDVLGEYFTAPGTDRSKPSRTTVDLDGNGWVANREDNYYDPNTQQWTGSVTRFGLLIGGTRCEVTGRPNPYGEYAKPPFKYNTCVDRNRDGLIQTSPPTELPLPLPLPWYGPRYESRATALDEAVLNYVRVDSTGTRHVSVNADNDVWVAGSTGENPHVFNQIDGVTGEVRPEKTFNQNAGGYGGIMDCAGVIWSARDNLLRYNPDDPSPPYTGFCSYSYGVGIDSQGNIWSTNFDYDMVCKLHADGSSCTGFPKPCGGDGPKGLAATWEDNNVWIANCGSGTVTRLDENGTICEVIEVGNWPTGIAVDSNGYIWTTNEASDSVSCIVPGTDPPAPCGTGTDPSFVLDEFDLGQYAAPYNYSDMTGQVALHTTATGTWNVVHDGGKFGAEWHLLRWNREAGCEAPPEDLLVAVRAADHWTALTSQPYLLVEDGKRFNDVVGRYIETRVRFKGSCPDEDPQTPFWTPVMCDLYAEWGIADMNCDGQLDFGDINPFVMALSNPAGYTAAHPRCDIMLGDINGDGLVGFGDINPFVALMAEHGIDVKF